MSELKVAATESLWKKLDPVQLLPPITFCAVGFGLLMLSGRISRQELDQFVTSIDPVKLVIAAVFILGSLLAVRTITDGVLRFLEGYNWGVPGLSLIKQTLTSRNQKKFRQEYDRLSEFVKKYKTLNAAPPDVADEMADLVLNQAYAGPLFLTGA